MVPAAMPLACVPERRTHMVSPSARRSGRSATAARPSLSVSRKVATSDPSLPADTRGRKGRPITASAEWPKALSKAGFALTTAPSASSTTTDSGADAMRESRKPRLRSVSSLAMASRSPARISCSSIWWARRCTTTMNGANSATSRSMTAWSWVHPLSTMVRTRGPKRSPMNPRNDRASATSVDVPAATSPAKMRSRKRSPSTSAPACRRAQPPQRDAAIQMSRRTRHSLADESGARSSTLQRPGSLLRATGRGPRATRGGRVWAGRRRPWVRRRERGPL